MKTTMQPRILGGINNGEMNEHTLADFEQWANSYAGAFDLTKTPAMQTDNPYAVTETWKAYEAWCDSRTKYMQPPANK